MKFFSPFPSWLLTASEEFFLLRLDGDDDDDDDECLGVTYFSNGSAILIDEGSAFSVASCCREDPRGTGGEYFVCSALPLSSFERTSIALSAVRNFSMPG